MVWIVGAWVASLVVTWVIATHLAAGLTYSRTRAEFARKLWLEGQAMFSGAAAQAMFMAIGFKVFGRVVWDRTRAGLDEFGREVTP